MTFTTRPTLHGTFGMVATTHWLASQSAMRMLELGGNAFDAAAAAGFVLHVVEPHLNGPGGDLPAIVSVAADPGPRVLCGQGPAPVAATPDRYTALGLDLVPGSGPLAAAVPGAVDAWLLLLRDHGTLPLETVTEPAIGYARHGHPVLERVADLLARMQDLFGAHWQSSAELWLADGLPRAGDLLHNRAWAHCLARLVAAGAHLADVADQAEAARREWREGFVADAVDAFAQSEWWHPGDVHARPLVTGADLAAFSATWEVPALLDWQGVQVAKTDLWGQGPTLLQLLALTDRFGGPAALDLDSEQGVHTLAELWKLVMADREAWYGDRSPVAVAELLAEDYLTERAGLVGDTATDTLRPGSPGGRTPHLSRHVQHLLRQSAPPQVAHDPTTGEPTVRRDGTVAGDTCHVDVVDRWGNAISATPSGGWLQSSPAIPGLGFCLGTRAQMFWLDDGLPTSLAPGARPRTTLSPTMVMRDGVPVLACGTPGGDQQDEWQSLFLLRWAAGASLQEAVDAPAFHTESFPASFWPRGMAPGELTVEDRFDQAVVQGLARRGHRIVPSGPWSLGRMCAVGRDPGTGLLTAAANPRGMQNYAVGR